MAKIFISYRRDDNPAAAARVRDGLALKFGKSNLFMDVDNLLAGLRFDEELTRALAACDVFIAVMGERWTELLKSKAASGERDFVREEIEAALQRKIVVIPIRVGRDGLLSPLPRADELPTEIRELIHYQKHDVTHENYGRDIAALTDAIKTVRRRTSLSGPNLRPWAIGGGLAATLALAYVVTTQIGAPAPRPPHTAQQEQAARESAEELERLRVAAARADDERRAAADEAAALRGEAERRRKADEEAQAKAEVERSQVKMADQASEAAVRISSLTSIGASSQWDGEVRSILVSAFGGSSDSIDTADKIAGVPCKVWRAMDDGIHRGSTSSSLATTYGFAPNYVWVDVFGIAEEMRPKAYARLQACGVATN